MWRELVCTAPATPARLALRSGEVRKPRPGEVLLRVEATSVNPIDVKRAGGYGRRLLGLKGAASFPLVLGNDVAGVVEAIGPSVSRFAPGQRVFGLVATGRDGGAHASHVVVPQDQLVAAPDMAEPVALAVLPYSFTTMWLAVRSTGLSASNAAAARVLVLGACGGLGQLGQNRLVGDPVKNGITECPILFRLGDIREQRRVGEFRQRLPAVGVVLERNDKFDRKIMRHLLRRLQPAFQLPHSSVRANLPTRRNTFLDSPDLPG